MTDSGPQKQVLVVEDNLADASLFMRFAAQHGPAFACLHLIDGEAVLDHLARSKAPSGPTKPDLIVLDLGLPKVTGFEVLRQIKADAELQTIPVVVLSTSSHAADRERCLQLGAHQYLTKAFDVAGCSRLVARIFQDAAA
jgi:CheY-like chemotaxis protein